MRFQSSRPKRQFLAGVACPHCQAKDAIVQVQRFEPEPDEYIECIECGHKEHRPSAEEVRQNNLKITNAGIRVVSVTE